MTQAVNLANFANYLDSSGGMSPNALNAAVPISKGGTGGTTASDARTNLGLGSVATLNTVPVANGGTGATTASTARTNLGLATIASSGSASDLSSGTVAVGRLGSSGTASSSTFLRGDNTWATPPTNAGTVTSVATGNGLSGGTITSSGTLVIAAPGTNTIGSYVFAGYPFGENTSRTYGNTVAGSSLRCNASYTATTSVNANPGLSGTWMFLGYANTYTDPCTGTIFGYQNLLVRIS